MPKYLTKYTFCGLTEAKLFIFSLLINLACNVIAALPPDSRLDNLNLLFFIVFTIYTILPTDITVTKFLK